MRDNRWYCNLTSFHFISFDWWDMGLPREFDSILLRDLIWFDLIWFDFARTWSIWIPEKKWYFRIHRRQSTQRIDTIWPEYISKLNSNFKFQISKLLSQISHFKFQTLISMPRQTRSNLTLSKRPYSVWCMDIYAASCSVNLLFRLFASAKYEEQLSFNCQFKSKMSSHNIWFLSPPTFWFLIEGGSSTSFWIW